MSWSTSTKFTERITIEMLHMQMIFRLSWPRTIHLVVKEDKAIYQEQSLQQARHLQLVIRQQVVKLASLTQ